MEGFTNANSSASCAGSTITSSAARNEKEVVSQAMILGACKAGDAEKLRLWTSRGTHVHNNEAVRCAVVCEQLHVLRYLLGDLGADVHQVDKSGLTFLLIAIYGKLLDVIRCLVEECGADVNQSTLSPEGNHMNPLIMAVENNMMDVMQCLVEELGADVSQLSADVDGNQFTPLVTAVQHNMVNSMRILVKEYGADVNQPAFSCHGIHVTPLIMAVELDKVNLVQILVEELGADVNRAGEGGTTPLFIAALNGKLDIVLYLAELGANINQQTDTGRTALFAAAQEGHLDILRCLIEDHGADFSQRLDSGTTLLLVAAHEGNIPLVQWLLVEGHASITESNENGQTVWNILNLKGADDGELVSLLRVMLLLDDAPPGFTLTIPLHHARICTRGRQFRVQLPAYLDQQKDMIRVQCPLPTVLQHLVATYAAPTSEDVWMHGLRVWVVECSKSGCSDAGLLRCTACRQVRYCGQPCQRADWKAHNAECEQLRADQSRTGQRTASN
jgi:ankyrin repeat protein